MTNPESAGKIPCVDQPALKEFDKDGDGVVSFDELRPLLPMHDQLAEVIAGLEAQGIVGIRYTGCSDNSSGGTNGDSENLANLIARAAIAQLYDDR